MSNLGMLNIRGHLIRKKGELRLNYLFDAVFTGLKMFSFALHEIFMHSNRLFGLHGVLKCLHVYS